VFTGIVAEVGRVRDARARDGIVALTLDSSLVRGALARGGSVAVNGCCQTVTALDERGFTVEIMPVTAARTTLGGLAAGAPVNLEAPMRAGDPIGGHFVQGHVDGVGEVVSVAKDGGDHRVRVRVPAELGRYLVPRGSVTVDGVSLTVAAAEGDGFTVAFIPTTLAETTAGAYAVGRRVNVEVDVVARYLERLLAEPGGGREGTS
jgi:riboflavin synthase